MTLTPPPTPIPANHRWLFPYMKARFSAEGQTFQEGFNCWTMTAHIYKNVLGIELPLYDTIPLADMLKVRDTIDDQKSIMTWSPIPIGEEQGFDVALMKSVARVQGKLKSVLGHVGLITEPGKLIHIDPQLGVVHGSFRTIMRSGSADRRLENRVVEIYRHEALI